MPALKSVIKKILRRTGYEVVRYRVGSSHSARTIAMLSHQRVNVVLDVGANVGQFGMYLRDIGYGGSIVSFEPMAAAHSALRKAAAGDGNWEVAPRIALGAKSGEVAMNIAGNSESSSILPMLDAHRTAAPESYYIGTERVELRRLDSIAAGYLSSDAIPFVKIDTQGYENEVLEGAEGILPRVVGLQVELSLMPLYAGGRLMSEMVESLQDRGFDLWSVESAFVDPYCGRVLQVDGTFFRRSAAS